jgi:hypothetical protein
MPGRKISAKSVEVLFIVMAGLVPAIYVFVLERLQDVDARNECGHDELG